MCIKNWTYTIGLIGEKNNFYDTIGIQKMMEKKEEKWSSTYQLSVAPI